MQFLCLGVCCGALIICATADPGIVRSRPNVDLVPDDFRSEFIEEEVNGVRMKRKWCQTCRHYRPLRARHCREVDLCIHRFCHFCPWTNNAIGSRNNRSFLVFVMATCALCWSICWGVLRVAWLENKTADVEGFLFQLFTQLHRYILLVLGVTVGAALTHLGISHLQLVLCNMTAAEQVKKDFEHGNPYSSTRLENLKSFWLHPRPDSVLQVTGQGVIELGARSSD